jgi:hypothetical protein
MCLEPPLQVDELPEEETWYCKECSVERVSVWSIRWTVGVAHNQAPKRQPSPQREPRPIPTVFKQLIRRVEDENPATFKLPLDIRQFFNGSALSISTHPQLGNTDRQSLRIREVTMSIRRKRGQSTSKQHIARCRTPADLAFVTFHSIQRPSH